MKAKSTQQGRLLLLILTLVMAVRICSYFTLFPDSIGVTRVVKIALRLCVTSFSGAMFLILMTKLPTAQIKKVNILPLIFYGCYLLLGLLSFLWSSGIGFSSLQWIMTTESLVFVALYTMLLLASIELFPEQIRFAHILGVSIGIISVGFVIGLFIDPELFYRQTHGGEVSRLGGFIINPNELGMLVVLGAAMSTFELYCHKKKSIHVPVVAICIAVLLLTQSRSSLGAFALVMALFVYLSKNKLIKLGSIITGVLALPVIVNTIIVKTGDIEEVLSMTGRLPFWTDLINDSFPREPIWGFGFMRISYSDKFDSIHAYAAAMTHNTFVQVLLNLGLVGAFIVILQMAATTYAIVASEDKKLKLMVVSILIPLIINSLTEFGIFGESNYGIMFYQFIILFFTITLTKRLTFNPLTKRYSL